MRKILIALGVVGLVAGACALTGGTTSFIGAVQIWDGDSAPTCATATTDGELCAAGDIETNGAIDVAGASTLTGAIAGGAAISAATTITSTTSQYILVQANLGATCTVGELKIDTETTKELCYCAVADTWYCFSATTADGPTD